MTMLITAAKRVQDRLQPITTLMRKTNIHSMLALSGMAGPLILGITDMTAALTSPGYSFIRDSISSLALTSLGWIQTIGFLAIGLLVEIFTAGLLYNIRPRRWFHLGIVLFVIFGFAMLLIGAFHTDPVGGPRTIEGRIHGIAASTAFWLFPIAILLLSSSIRNDPHWSNIFKYTIATVALAVVFGVSLAVIPDESGWFGLLERLLVANMIIWVEVAAIKLFILSLRRGRPVASEPKAGPATFSF
ncbi:MAG: DUF998 domain-containing protein [Dehalococcoidales bacterium]|nr:DUF998 domain-containing protein [Dehalococcoidales bacterium]